MSRKMRFGSSRQRQRDQGGKNPETDEPHVLIEEREDVGALADSHKPEPLSSNNPAELKPSHSENTGLDTMGKRKKLGSTRRHRDRQDLNELRVEAAKNTCEEISDDTALGVAQSSELHHRADSLEADRFTPGMDVLLVHGEFPPPDLKHRPELRRDDAHPSPSTSMADEGEAGDTEFEVEHRESMSTNKSTQVCPESKTSTSKNLQIESKLDFEVLAELHTIESEGAGKVIYDKFSQINQLGLNPAHLQEPTVSELLSKNQVYLIGQAMQDTDGQHGEEKHISIPVEVPGDEAHRSRHAGMGNDSEGIGGGEMDQEQCLVNLEEDSTLSESLNMPEVESEIKLEIIAGVSGSPACVRGPGSSYEYNITTPESLDQSDSTLLGEVTLTEDTEMLDSFFSQPFPQLSQAEDEFSYKVTETCSASTEGEVHPVDNPTQDTQLSTVQVQDPNVDFMEDYFDSAVNETTILNPDDNKDSTFAYLSEVRRAEAHQAREVAPGLYQVYGNKAKGRASEGSVEGDMALQDTGSLCGPSEGVDFTLLVSPTQKTGTVHAACASLCTPDETESESETRLTFQSESKAPVFGEVEQSEDVLLTANDSVHLSLSGLTKTSKTPGGQDASVPTSYQLGDQLSSYSNIADRQRDLMLKGSSSEPPLMFSDSYPVMEDITSEPFGDKISSFIDLPEVHISRQSFDSNVSDANQLERMPVESFPLFSPLDSSECHGESAHPESNTTGKRRKMGSTRRNQRGRREEHTEGREEDATIPKTVGEVEDSIITEATPSIEKIEFRDSTKKAGEEEREREIKAGANMIADIERDKGFEVEELQQLENKLSTEEESDHTLPQRYVSHLDDKGDPSGLEKGELEEQEGAKDMFQDWEKEPNVEPVSVEDLSDSRNIVYNINFGQNFSTSHESMSNEPLPMSFSDTYTVMDDNSSEPFRATISSLINLPEVHISGLSFDSNVADASQSDDAEITPVESFPLFLPPVSSDCHGESVHPESNTTGKRRKMGSTRRSQRGRRGDKSNSENQEDEMTEPDKSLSAVPKEEVTEPNDGTSAAQNEEVTDPDAGPSAAQKVKKNEGYNATIEMTCHNILNQSLKQEQTNSESVDMYETGPLQNTENVVQEANMDPDTQGRRRKMGSTRRLGERRGEQTGEERQEEEEDTGVADEMKPRGEEEITAESKSAIDKTELKMMKTEFKLLGELTENVSEEGKDREQMSNSPISYDDTVSNTTSYDTLGSTRRTQGLTGEGAWQETQEGKNKGHIEGAEKEELAELNTSMELTGDKVGPVQSKRKRMGSSRRHGQGPLGKDNLGKDGNEPDLSSIGEEHSAEVLHLEKQTEAGGPDKESTHIEVVTSDWKGDKRLLHNAPGLREGLGHTGSAGLPEQLEATEASVGNTRRPAGQVEKSMVTKEKRQLQGSPRNLGSGEVTYNVMMVGNTHVGKTSFIKRFESGEFYLDVCASVGIDTCKQSLLVDGKPVTLQLWDTAGQERYRSITRQVFHRAQAILLMYDITSSQSFCDVRYWLSCIQEGAPEDVIIMLLGNKSECAKREVESQEGESLAKEYNFLFMECSAATGDNVLKSLETVVRMMRQKAENSGTGSTVLHKEPPVKKSSCC